MTAKFTSMEELNDIAASLPSDFSDSRMNQEFKEKGITISFEGNETIRYETKNHPNGSV